MAVSFEVPPGAYRHWRLAIDGPVATVAMDVAEDGGGQPGYELKLNSYDLGVDVELADIVQRLRFGHPEVRAVVLTSAKDKVFCAGANIRMLAQAEHAWKVNFCKFTNETRLAIEDASEHSGQVWIAACGGTASGGGYELALACDTILLVDDRAAAVALPELPLLGVLPATGGLTRLVDKRRVRRDIADLFATRAAGVQGRTAVDWHLVDEVVPRVGFAEHVAKRAAEAAARSARAPGGHAGLDLPPLERRSAADRLAYRHVGVEIDRENRSAVITVSGPDGPPPESPDGIDASLWSLAMTRELDDAVLHLRTNETEIGTWLIRTRGSRDLVLAADAFLLANREHWLVNEVVLYLKRTLKRLDVTSRSIIALVEPGSCFAGSLFELALAADRCYMLAGAPPARDAGGAPDMLAGAPPTRDAGGAPDMLAGAPAGAEGGAATVTVGPMNLGPLPMGNGLTRLATRFHHDPDAADRAAARAGRPLTAAAAVALGLVTAAPDELDWDDEVRLAVEERASFSPDALTGLEANIRFVGPETMETKIFARLTAWQNWIFLRANASGPEGALRRYGTGQRPAFDRHRV